MNAYALSSSPRRICGASLALLAAAAAFAQTGTPPAPVTPVSDDEAVTLSPFAVTTAKDDGFVAASSLAGGRMKTDLRDTALAYSVLTGEFLAALNLTDVESALSWTVGANLNADPGYGQLYGSDNNISLRGAGVGSTSALLPQQNFFFIGLNTDNYRNERIDVARGPNAVLVGNAGMGGTVVAMTKRARTDKATIALNLNYGSWAKRRAALDVNQPLGAKAAVRVNALVQRANFWRDVEFDDRHGLFGTVTLKPWKHTTVRAEAEYYRNDKATPDNRQADFVSGWDGVTVNDGRAAPASNNAQGVQLQTGEILSFTPSLGADTVLNRSNLLRTMGGGQNVGTPVGGVLPLSTTNLNVSGSQRTLINELNMPSYRFAKVLASPAKFALPRPAFSLMPDTPTYVSQLHNYSAFLEQQVGQHLFLEVAGNLNRSNRSTNYGAFRGLVNVYLDLNKYLPGGTVANPKFLEPYGESQRFKVNNLFDAREGRFAAALVFDHTRWGDFRANFIAGERFVESAVRMRIWAMQRNADARQRPYVDAPYYRYYWSDNGTAYPDPASVSYAQVAGGPAQTYAMMDMLDLTRTASQRLGTQDFTYLQSAFNARLFKGRVNLTAGARRDTVTIASRRMTSVPRVEQYTAGWDGSTELWLPKAPADFYQLQYRLRNADGSLQGPDYYPADTRPRDAGGNPLPQYANDRFKSDYSVPDIEMKVNTVSLGGVVHALPWLSAYYNIAETFNPSQIGQRITGDLTPPVVAKGWDGGLRFTLLGGRLHAALGAYGSDEDNNSFNPNTFGTGSINSLLQANAVGDLSVTGRNIRGIQDIPNPFFDFNSRKAEGYELEVVANVTRDWRLTANLALPKVRISNQLVDTLKWLADNDTTLRQIVKDAGGLIDAGNVALPDPAVVSANAPGQSAAVTSWNTLQNTKKNINAAGNPEQRVNSYTANVFTDYRFRDGRLKGLRVGLGANFRGPQIIGFRGTDTIVNPANPTTAIDDPNADNLTEVHNSGYYLVTATLGYERKIREGMFLRLNLLVSNLTQNGTIVYIGTVLRPPGGDVLSPARVATPSGYYYQTPRAYSLTASLSF